MHSATTLSRADDPLALRLPDWVDTNETYQFVTPEGQTYDVVWDFINNMWCVVPF